MRALIVLCIAIFLMGCAEAIGEPPPLPMPEREKSGIFIITANSFPYFGVFDCKLTGPGEGGGIHANTGCIVFFQNEKFRIENNEISNAPRPIYFKHANPGLEADADWKVRNNWFKGTVGQSFIGGRYGEVSNNIFDMNLSIANSGGGVAPFGNTYNHNTFMGGYHIFDGDGIQVINDMVSLNNIVIADYSVDEFGTSVYSNTCTSNYQLYGADIIVQGVTYNLPTWQSNSIPPNQDINSIAGLPTFVGGATPTTIAGYKLNGGLGVNAANDGADMGADVSLVGVR